MLNQINDFFGIFVGFLEPILFMQLNGFPLIVLVLLSGALIFTLYFRFINVRGFMHSIDIIKGKYDNPKDTVSNKFATPADARATVAKVKRVKKPFARKIQILTVGEQRAKVMGKSQVASIFKRGKDAIRKTKKV